MGQSAARPELTDGGNVAAADFVNKTVDEHCVVIFSKSYCPYCDDAMRIFMALGTPVHRLELDAFKDGDTVMRYLHHSTKANTVPRIFVNGKCIGGFKETKQLWKSGVLRELIQQCLECKS